MAQAQSAISDALVAKVCRSTPAEAQALGLTLSDADRAKLALFCNAKTHLRAQGREIARTCTEASLVREGGLAGALLLRQVDAPPDGWGVVRHAHRSVNLDGSRSAAS